MGKRARSEMTTITIQHEELPPPSQSTHPTPNDKRSRAVKSARSWNSALLHGRRSRGPQWDYATAMYHVPKESKEYYAGVTRIPEEPKAGDDPPKRSASPSKAIDFSQDRLASFAPPPPPPSAFDPQAQQGRAPGQIQLQQLQLRGPGGAQPPMPMPPQPPGPSMFRSGSPSFNSATLPPNMNGGPMMPPSLGPTTPFTPAGNTPRPPQPPNVNGPPPPGSNPNPLFLQAQAMQAQTQMTMGMAQNSGQHPGMLPEGNFGGAPFQGGGQAGMMGFPNPAASQGFGQQNPAAAAMVNRLGMPGAPPFGGVPPPTPDNSGGGGGGGGGGGSGPAVNLQGLNMQHQMMQQQFQMAMLQRQQQQQQQQLAATQGGMGGGVGTPGGGPGMMPNAFMGAAGMQPGQIGMPGMGAGNRAPPQMPTPLGMGGGGGWPGAMGGGGGPMQGSQLSQGQGPGSEHAGSHSPSPMPGSAPRTRTDGRPVRQGRERKGLSEFVMYNDDADDAE